MYPFLLKVMKFGLTGLIGMAIDFGVTWMCKERLKWNRYIANSFGFSLAVTNNYWLNRRWTFSSENPFWLKEFGRFLLISIIGLAINNIVIYLFHQRKATRFYLAKFFAILIVFVWNFCANYFFTFR